MAIALSVLVKKKKDILPIFRMLYMSKFFNSWNTCKIPGGFYV